MVLWDIGGGGGRGEIYDARARIINLAGSGTGGFQGFKGVDLGFRVWELI